MELKISVMAKITKNETQAKIAKLRAYFKTNKNSLAIRVIFEGLKGTAVTREAMLTNNVSPKISIDFFISSTPFSMIRFDRFDKIRLPTGQPMSR